MAKHWKSFVKKETTPVKEELDFKTLLSSGGKEGNKSLEDVAGFNTNLKSLLEEQKELEDKMAALTGTDKDKQADKRYDNEIKSVYQKRKEEKEAAKKKAKSKKKKDEWKVDTVKKRKSTPEKDAFSRNFKKKEEGFLRATKEIKRTVSNIQKENKKLQKPVEIFSKNKTKKVKVSDLITNARKGKKLVSALQKNKAKSSFRVDNKKKSVKITKKESTELLKNKTKRNINKELKSKTEKTIVTLREVKKVGDKLENFVDNSLGNTSFQKEDKVTPQKSKGFENVVKVTKKTVNTFKSVKKISNNLNTGVEKIGSKIPVDKSSDFGKTIDKVGGILNKADKKIKKVDTLFNSANKYLDKTSNVVGLFNKKVSNTDFIKTKDLSVKDAFNLDVLQQKKEKQEESESFKVENKKLTVDLGTIKKIKKGIYTLKSVKNTKDSFSF